MRSSAGSMNPAPRALRDRSRRARRPVRRGWRSRCRHGFAHSTVNVPEASLYSQPTPPPPEQSHVVLVHPMQSHVRLLAHWVGTGSHANGAHGHEASGPGAPQHPALKLTGHCGLTYVSSAEVLEQPQRSTNVASGIRRTRAAYALPCRDAGTARG
jgi:hypothetical protein